MSKAKKPRTKKKRTKRTVLWVLVALLSAVLLGLILIHFFGLPAAALPDEESSLPALKVIVKNGCGVENLATDYSDYVKDKNMDVVSMGDTPQPIWNKSVIEVKTDDKQDLARLQKMTGIKRYTLAVDPDAPAPFVIILGDDFEEYMKP